MLLRQLGRDVETAWRPWPSIPPKSVLDPLNVDLLPAGTTAFRGRMTRQLRDPGLIGNTFACSCPCHLEDRFSSIFDASSAIVKGFFNICCWSAASSKVGPT